MSTHTCRHTHVYTHMSTHTCLHTHAYPHMSTHKHVYTHMSTPTCPYDFQPHTLPSTLLSLRAGTLIHLTAAPSYKTSVVIRHACVHACVQACVRACVRACMRDQACSHMCVDTCVDRCGCCSRVATLWEGAVSDTIRRWRVVQITMRSCTSTYLHIHLPTPKRCSQRRSADAEAVLAPIKECWHRSSVGTN